MKIDLPKQADLIIKMLQEKGYEGYVVGGCVRDSLSGATPNDWDITTNALPNEILDVFAGYKTIDVGIKHGTVAVIMDNDSFEITTYRVDGPYRDYRRPEKVSFSSKLKDDLKRRDFTVNAMAYNHDKGIIDYFNGQEDLKYQAIRCVGNPDKRFSEDALRMLRALRFASVLGYTIEPNTSSAIKKNKELLSNIASERVAGELNKLLCGENADYILRRYKEIFAVIIPEVEIMFGYNQNNPHHNKSLWNHTASAVKFIEQDPVLRMTMLLHDIGKPLTEAVDEKGISHFKGHQVLSGAMANNILKRLNYSNDFIKNVLILIEYHDTRFNGSKKHIKKILSQIGIYTFYQLLKVQQADLLAQSTYQRAAKQKNLDQTKAELTNIIMGGECFSLTDLNINGKDLIRLGVDKGVKIGNTLQYLLELVINEEIANEKSKLLAKAKEYQGTA